MGLVLSVVTVSVGLLTAIYLAGVKGVAKHQPYVRPPLSLLLSLSCSCRSLTCQSTPPFFCAEARTASLCLRQSSTRTLSSSTRL